MDSYYPLIEGDILPDYLERNLNRLIRQYYDSELEQMSPDAALLSDDMIALEDALAAFGETSAQKEAFFQSDACRELFLSRGFSEEPGRAEPV